MDNQIKKKIVNSAMITLVIMLFWLGLFSLEHNMPTTGSAVSGTPEWIGETKYVSYGEFKLDLARHFKDESAALSYYVSDAEHLSTIIKNGELIVTPEPGFIGESTFTIYASDGKDLVEQRIILEIQAEPQFTVPPVEVVEEPIVGELSPGNLGFIPEQFIQDFGVSGFGITAAATTLVFSPGAISVDGDWVDICGFAAGMFFIDCAEEVFGSWGSGEWAGAVDVTDPGGNDVVFFAGLGTGASVPTGTTDTFQVDVDDADGIMYNLEISFDVSDPINEWISVYADTDGDGSFETPAAFADNSLGPTTGISGPIVVGGLTVEIAVSAGFGSGYVTLEIKVTDLNGNVVIFFQGIQEKITWMPSETICDDGLDNDGDGPKDCLDEDCDGLPGGLGGELCQYGIEKLCADFFDNDGDGLTDGADPDCSIEWYCDDLVDNDDDTLTDCADSDCNGQDGGGFTCEWPSETLCSDGFDNDGDGATDAADPDCLVEICNNLGDDDGDGDIDCLDWDCQYDPSCAEDCGNGLDDDSDGLTDCQDPICDGIGTCEYPERSCADLIDNDADGLQDCADLDCSGDPSCIVAEDCGNLADDDDDLLIDCYDPDCFGEPISCSEETGYCDDGQDNDGDGMADCLDNGCDGQPGSGGTCQFGIETFCTDGFDNDGDGGADCAEPDNCVLNDDETVCNYCQGLTSWALGGDAAIGSCCGNDPGEFVTLATAGPSLDGVLSDDACCNEDTDCTFNDVCYPVGTTVDVDSDGDLDICVAADTWDDCSVDAQCSGGWSCDGDCNYIDGTVTTGETVTGDDQVYQITSSLVASLGVPGLTISANNVVLNCLDTITGDGTSDGIVVTGEGIVLNNCLFPDPGSLKNDIKVVNARSVTINNADVVINFTNSTNVTVVNSAVDWLYITNSSEINIINSSVKNFTFDTAVYLSVENTSFGKVTFLENVTEIGTNMFIDSTSDIRWSNNSLFVNSSSEPGFNVTANITLYNVGSGLYPYISYDGATYTYCAPPTCYIINNSGNDLVFNTSHFSFFQGGSDPYGGYYNMQTDDNVSWMGHYPDEDYAYYGATLDWADLNGDGHADAIVGAYNNNTLTSKGLVRIFYGPVDNVTDVYFNDKANVTISGTASMDLLGSCLGSGDINNDGFDDLLIGGFCYPGGNCDGGVFLIMGQPANINSGVISSVANTTFTGQGGFGEVLGTYCDTADVDGDGQDDILMSSFGTGYSGDGITYLVYGSRYPFGSSATIGPPGIGNFEDASWTNSGSAGYEFVVRNAGDINNDNYEDFLIGGPNNNTAYLILGQVTQFNSAYTTSLVANATFTGEANLGFSVSSAGDVNNDGYDDFLLADPSATAGETSWAGVVYLMYGGANAWSGTYDLTNQNNYNASFQGYQVSYGAGVPHIWSEAQIPIGTALSYGDFNDDSYSDFLVGSGHADIGEAVDNGEVVLVYGKPTFFSGNYSLDYNVGDVNASFYGELSSDYLSSVPTGMAKGVEFEHIMMGAYGFDDPGEAADEGKVYIMYGLSQISFGETITSNTTLTQNLSGSGDGITIGADNIILDCAGYYLNGDGSGIGIKAENRNNIIINNCNFESSNFVNDIKFDNCDNCQILNTDVTINITNSNNDNITNSTVDALYITNSNNTHIEDSTVEVYDLNNALYTSIESTTYGEVKFLQSIIESGTNMYKNSTSDIRIGSNSFIVNSSSQTGFNISANISLYGLSLNEPSPYVDRNDDSVFEGKCTAPTCYNLSYSGGTFIFNTTHFTEYTAGEQTAGLSCSVRQTSCNTGETPIMKMSSTANAHAELVNGTNYDYLACCRDLSNSNTLTNSSGTNILDLSSITNAHSEIPGQTNYTYNVYLGATPGTINCSYDYVSGSCSANRTCVATISGTTDAHIADCNTDPYNLSVCCQIDQALQFGDTITTNTTLTQNLSGQGNGLIIGASNIELDCDGYALIGDSSGYGVYTNNKQNITIKNCIISNFSEGIYFYNTSKSTAFNNTLISIASSGIYLHSPDLPNANNNISNNILYSNHVGIATGGEHNNSIYYNLLYNNNFGITLGSNYNYLFNNTIFNSSSQGIYLGGTSNIAHSDTVYGNNHGFHTDSGGNTIINCKSYNNSNGITISKVSLSINNCNITNNTAYGIDNSQGTGMIIDGTQISNSGTADLRIVSANNVIIRDSTIPSYTFSSAGITLENTTYGEVDFLQSLTESGNNLFGNSSSDIRLDYNLVFVNSSAQPGLNTSANITIYSLPYSITPKVYADRNDDGTYDERCVAPTCSISSYDLASGILYFNSTHFTFYTSGTNIAPTQSTPILNSTTVYNYSNESITVYPQNVQDLDGDAVTNITNWYVDNKSLTVLNQPFDTNIMFAAGQTTKDYSPYNNIGNWPGVPGSSPAIWVSNGNLGGAFNFSSSNSEMMSIVDSNTLDMSSSFTVEFWMYSRTAGAYTVMGKFDTLNFAENYNFETDGSNKLYFRIANSTGSVCSVSTSSLGPNNWYHVAGVYNQQTGNISIYLDGSNVQETPCSLNISDCVTNSDLAIGAYYAGGIPSFFFNGMIDELRIYNRSLSSQQINYNYNSGTMRYDRIVSQETVRGETWYVNVTPNDATADGNSLLSNNITIENTPPTIPTIRSPPNATRTSNTTVTLTCLGSTDNDNDVIYYVFYGDQTNGATYLGNSTSGQYNWSVTGTNTYYWKCNAYDGYDYSVTNTSVWQFGPNIAPTQDTPILNSTYGTNYTNENLTVYPQNVQDAENDPLTKIINWFVNGVSILVLNMPFDSDPNYHNLATTRDYSPYENNGTLYDLTWNNSGISGGAFNFTSGIKENFSLLEQEMLKKFQINIPDDDSLDVANEITIEGWFRPNKEFNSTAVYYQTLLDKGVYQIFLDRSDSKLKTSLSLDSNKTWISAGGFNDDVYALAVWNGTLIAGGAFTLVNSVPANRTAQWNGTHWIPFVGGGFNRTVYTITIYEGDLVFGGDFNVNDGGQIMPAIARWDGSQWDNISGGCNKRGGALDPSVVALAEVIAPPVIGWGGYNFYGSNRSYLFAGGAHGGCGLFNPANDPNLACWNGTNWTSCGSTLDSGPVLTFAVYKNILYAGGNYNNLGSNSPLPKYIGLWNTSSVLGDWDPVGYCGPGGCHYPDAGVATLAVYKDELYMGGSFTSIGNISGLNGIARWNGTDWNNVGGGVYDSVGSPSSVEALAVWDGDLYVGGVFTRAGCSTANCSANHIARWNGSQWSKITNTGTNNGVNGDVLALANYQGQLYLGGAFGQAEGPTTASSGVIKWASGSEAEISSTTNNWSNSWHHFTTTYDGSSLKMYVDGILENTASAAGRIGNNSHNLILGSSHGSRYEASSSSNEERFNGLLDEIRIYNRALSPEQIAKNYNSGSPNYETIVSQETNPGETWYAEVTPNDGFDDGPTNASNNLTIRCSNLTTSTTLTKDIIVQGDCFGITANNVVLDCAGYSLTGNNSGVGIAASGQQNITIKNCRIFNFTNGLKITSSTHSSQFLNNTLMYNSYGGNYSGYNNLWTNNTLERNINHSFYAAALGNNDQFINNSFSRSITNSGFYSTSSANGVRFVNNSFNHNKEYGLFVSANSGNMLNDYIGYNEMINNSDYALWFLGCCGFDNNLTIVNNFVSQTSRYAISLQRIYNSVIANNTISNITSNAFGISIGGGDNNTVENNTITNITASGYGIYISGSTGGYFNISFNQITNNNNSLSGIFLNGGGSGLNIFNNTVVNNTGGQGIYSLAYMSGFRISDNILKNNSNGILISMGGTSGVIENNTIQDNSNAGLSITDLQNTNLSNNTVVNNTQYGYYFFASFGSGNNRIFGKNGQGASGSNNDLYIYEQDDDELIDASFKTYNIQNTKLKLENTTTGSIKFISEVSGSGSNLIGNSTSDIRLNSNSFFVDSAGHTGFNVSANLTMYGISGYTNPLPYLAYDDNNYQICTQPTCYNLSYIGTTYIFNTSHFTTFKINSDTAAPNTTQVIVNSSSGTNYTEEDLYCYAQGTDDFSDLFTAYYTWYNGTTPVLSGSTQVLNNTLTLISTLDSGNTTEGETWNCSVFMGDGFFNETDTNNATLFIETPNTLPQAPVLLIPSDGDTIITLSPTFIWNNSIDNENDTLTYHILVDDSAAFDAPEINISSIVEGTQNTSYTATVELTLDKVYYWKVRANDSEGYGSFSTVFNFTLASQLSINLTRNTVNFGQMYINQTNDTSDNSPLPFLVENTGNVFANITINGTAFFTQAAFPGNNYMYKVDLNETGAFDYGQSTTTYTPVNTTGLLYDIFNLNWRDTNDTAEIDINITVPVDEPAGQKTANITLTAS